MPTNPSVFVSHSHLDNIFGLRLIADLRARLGDDNVWYDVSGGLHGGDEWWREIVRQITARDVFVVILSSNALASPFVQREMAMAYQLHLTKNKRLLPIRYQPCDLEIDWEIIHWLPCRDPQIDAKGYSYNFAAILADLLWQPVNSQQISVSPVQPIPARVAPAASPPLRVQPTIALGHFPQRLASLGFVRRVLNGVEVIIPPLCDVPSGPFKMGSDPGQDRDAQADEQPQSGILVASFQIARYPCYARAVGQSYTIGSTSGSSRKIPSSRFPGATRLTTQHGWRRRRASPGGCRQRRSGRRPRAEPMGASIPGATPGTRRVSIPTMAGHTLRRQWAVIPLAPAHMAHKICQAMSGSGLAVCIHRIPITGRPAKMMAKMEQVIEWSVVVLGAANRGSRARRTASASLLTTGISAWGSELC